jgi:hypothetical protein
MPQRRGGLAKALHQTVANGARQRNFWQQHEGLLALGNGVANQVHVHLGFTAARYAL